MPKRIFISYRRSDTQMAAGRLYDALVGRFGSSSVFRDKEAIRPGYDWVAEIQTALAGDVAVLALIGPQWTSSQNVQGRRRLDDPQDSNRVELETALAQKVPVIPVLVEGATIPEAESLPEGLRPLTRRNAVRLRDDDWDADFARLAEALASLGMVSSVEQRKSRDGAAHLARRSWLAGGALAVFALVGTVVWVNSRDSTAERQLLESRDDDRRTDVNREPGAPKYAPPPAPAPAHSSVPAPRQSETTAPAVSPVPDISGTWRDMNYPGVVSQVTQNGQSFSVKRWGILPNGVGFEATGEGTIDGRRISQRYTTRYQTNVQSTGTCTGSVTTDGARIDSTCRDSLLGTFPTVSIRQ